MKKLFIALILLNCLQSFSQSRIVMQNSVRVVFNGGAFLVIDNSNANALTDNTNNSGIISENENNRIRWNIGTATGSYIIPFYDDDNSQRIPLTLNINTSGAGSGYIDFSTYDGSTWDNNTYRPSMVANTQLYFPPSTTNNSDKIIDRFWLLNAIGYTTKPAAGSIVFTYIDPEHSAAGNTINESLLGARRFNNSSGIWSDMLNIGTVNTGTNTVTTTPVTAANLFAAWSLTDPTCSIGGTTASSNSPVCDGSSLNLNSSGGTNYSWTGPGSFTSSQQNPVITPASPAESGTYTVIITDNYNCKDTLTVVAVVNTVTANAGPDDSVFNGGSTTLNGSASGGSGNYTYVWTPASSLVDPNLQNPQTVGLTVTTTFTVTVTDNVTGCTSTDQVIITVTGSALSANADANPATVCLGTSTQLSANAGGGSGTYTYTWASSPAGFSSSLANPVVSPATTTTYYVTVNDGASDVTSSIVVTVNATPSVTISSNSPVCEGKDIELTSAGGSTFSWSGPNGFISNSPTPTVTPATVADGGTYTVTVTNDLGCTSTATVDVTVNASPVTTSSSNSPVCEGNDINLFVTGGNSWIWTGPNSYSSFLQNPVITGATISDSGTYTCIISDANSCTSTENVSVTVNAGLVTTTTSNSPVCEGGDIQLDATGGLNYNWTGPNSFSSSSASTLISGASTIMSGTYYVTISDASGCSNTDSVTVTVGSLPVATANNNGPLCEGDTLYLTSGGGITYNWDGPNSFTSSSPTPAIINPTVLNSGTYTVTVTNTDGCSNTTTTDVTINQAPAISLSSNSPVCNGDSLALTVTGGTTWQWSGPNLFNSVSQSPVIYGATAANSGTYYVIVSDAGGCTSNDSINITVSTISISASSNSPLCEGSNIQLNASGGTTYQWTGPNSFSDSGSSPLITGATAANAGVYFVTVTDAAGCSDTTSLNVTVNLLPVVTVSNNSPFCEGDTLFLNATGGGTYSWAGPQSFTSNISNPFVDNTSSLNTGTYSVTVTSTDGCSSVATTDVTINSNPAASASANSPVCEGSDLQLTSSGGDTYSWSGPNSWTSSIQTPLINNADTSMNGIYYVTVTNTSGCSGIASVNVTIGQLPAVSASNNGPLCENNSLQLNSSGGDFYSWTGPDSFTSSQQNPVLTNITSLASGTYYVTVTNADGCTGTSSTTVIIDAAPVITLSASSPVCQNDSINLLSSGGGTYLWSGPGGFTSSVQNPSIPNAQAVNDGIYVLLVTGPNGCSSADSVTVNVQALPVVNCTSNNPFCAGDTLILSSQGGTIYTWTGPDGFTSTEQNPAITSPTVLNSGTYYVTVTDLYGCSNAGETTVSYPTPIVATSTVQQYPEYNTGAISLAVTGGSGSYQYDWSNGSNSSSLSNLHSGDYIVTITDSYLCLLIDTFRIDIPLIIPTLITPNRDGINDDFEIIGIGAYAKISVEIYNRWGDRLFLYDGSGQDYTVKSKRWDGTYNGKDLPMGSYVFIINLFDDKEPINGVCSIVR